MWLNIHRVAPWHHSHGSQLKRKNSTNNNNKKKVLTQQHSHTTILITVITNRIDPRLFPELEAKLQLNESD